MDEKLAIISLNFWDLSLVTALIVAIAVLSIFLRLGIAKSILIAATRTILQLYLIGFVLKYIFSATNVYVVLLICFVMLMMASREVYARHEKKNQTLRLGKVLFFISTISVLSSTSVMALIGILIVGPNPWYSPQYLIPILGMISGNTINGISIAIDQIILGSYKQSDMIENRLLMGQTPREAIRDLVKDSIKSALIPIINMMSIVGIVSLPGMMTGQILGGNPPLEAVKYQIVIMFLIASGTCLATIIGTNLTAIQLFDSKMRLKFKKHH